MKADARFTGQSIAFWGLVKLAGAELGYSKRVGKKNPTPSLMRHSADDIRRFVEVNEWDFDDATIDLAACDWIAKRFRSLSSTEPACRTVGVLVALCAGTRSGGTPATGRRLRARS